MKTELIHSLTDTFEGHAQHTEGGVEYWLARDLQHLLGYSKWENFQAVIAKAKTACEVSGHEVENHFPDVRKMVKIGSGTEREIDDLMLTRYACYLIAQNGDPRKEAIAFAQTYFAVQTRRAELIEQRLLEAERVQARQKLTTTRPSGERCSSVASARNRCRRTRTSRRSSAASAARKGSPSKIPIPLNEQG